MLSNTTNSPVARMAAGLQIKNALTAKDSSVKEQFQQRWLAFPEDIRLYIKENVSNGWFKSVLKKFVCNVIERNFSHTSIRAVVGANP